MSQFLRKNNYYMASENKLNLEQK